MKSFISSGFIVGFVLVGAGCGSPHPPEGTETRISAVSGGQVETGYPAVGCLLGTKQCTGTLIAPNLVVSAKHCGPMNTFNLGNTCGGGTPAQTRNVDYQIPYHADEGTGPSESIYSYDLVVHHLSQPIYDVRPLQINPLGYPANGTNCVAVGYGLDGMGGSGTKRSATITVESSGEVGATVGPVGWVGMHSSVKIVQGPAGSSPPPGLPEHGDSGSPLLCNGTGVIQGVFSGTFTTPFSGSYYTGITALQSTAATTMFDSSWITNVASNYINEPMVSATSWGVDRFDLYARGTDGALYIKTWLSGNWYPSMFGWSGFGGFMTGTPEAIAWNSSRIDVFMRGGDPNPQTDSFNSMTLLHFYWDGSNWIWQQIGTGGLASHPVAVSWGASRLDVFALASNGHIYHYYSNDGQNWLLEGVPVDDSVPPVGPTTFLPLMKAISTSSGNLDLYAVGTDNVPYHNHYNSSGVWSGWDNLGGQVMGTPAVTSSGVGKQDIFFKGFDGNLYQKAYIQPWPPLTRGWSPSQYGYFALGGPIDGSPAAASIQSGWLTLLSNYGNSGGETESLGYKGWFSGSQWAPTNSTWVPFGGNSNGAPTLLRVPVPASDPRSGVNIFSVDPLYTPGIGSYKPNGPQPYGLTSPASIGGTISW